MSGHFSEPMNVWSQSGSMPQICTDILTDLKVVFFRLASHDDVKGLVGVLGTSLDAVGHVLLVLIGIEPHTKCPCITS